MKQILLIDIGSTLITRDRKIIPGVRERLALYKDHLIIGMSDKYGIYYKEARSPKYQLEDIILMFQAVLKYMPWINRVYFSVDSRGYNLGLVTRFSAGIVPLTKNFHSFRKPSIGIPEVIQCEFPDSIIEVVGDSDKDRDLAHNINAKFTFAGDWLNELIDTPLKARAVPLGQRREDVT